MQLTFTLITSSLVTLSILNFLFQRNSFLMALMSLEMITLTLTFMIVISSSYNNDYFFALVILTAGTAEASFALALLARMAHSLGNDKLSSLMVNKLN